MKQLLIGTWILVRYEIERPGGIIVEPFGPRAAGLLIYTSGGYMSGQVMNPSRPPLAAGYRLKGDPAPAASAFEGYIAYCGRWDFDEERGEVLHTVEASLYPNWVGTTQRRSVRLVSSDALVLSTETPRSDGAWISRLHWRRTEP